MRGMLRPYGVGWRFGGLLGHGAPCAYGVIIGVGMIIGVGVIPAMIRIRRPSRYVSVCGIIGGGMIIGVGGNPGIDGG